MKKNKSKKKINKIAPFKSEARQNQITSGAIKTELLLQRFYKNKYKGKELKERLKKSNKKIKELKGGLL